jgi:hypothetical protein
MKTESQREEITGFRLPRSPPEEDDWVRPGGWLSRRYALRAREKAMKELEPLFLDDGEVPEPGPPPEPPTEE